jgi:transposase-like protein
MSILSAPHFHNEEAAIEFLESIIYANGVFCPKCGNVGESYKIKGQRPGLRCCKACRKQFTVKVGTVFESSHIPVTKWLQATHLLCASKKGCSAHQLHRMIGVTYKTAWFMMHRIREAMAPGGKLSPLGGEGKTVEADETYLGGLEKNKHAKDRKHIGRGGAGKEAVFSLVERSGKVRSTHVQSVNAETCA